VLYKVVGKTCSDMNALRHCYNGPWMGIIVRLIPGDHNFELVVIRDKHAENLSFATSAGSDYELVEEKGLFRVYRKTGEARSDIEVKRVVIPFYQEPDKSAPHGLLVQNEETRPMRFRHILDCGRPGTLRAFRTSNIFVALGTMKSSDPGKHVMNTLRKGGSIRKRYSPGRS
jgi:hypothetical protein